MTSQTGAATTLSLRDRLRVKPERRPLLAAVLVLIILFVIGVVSINGFGTFSSVNAVLILSAFLGVAATGETMCILLGAIDLTVPFVMDMSNVMSAQLTSYGVPFGVSVAAALACGVAIGMLNGFLSSRLKIEPLVVSLGLGYVAQGAVEVWNNGAPSGSSPQWLVRTVSQGSHIGPAHLAPVIVVWVVIGAASIFWLRRSTTGRRLYAVGTSREAARFALVNPVRIWTVAFGLSGFFAAVAGVLLLGSSGSALDTAGDSYMFLVIAAVMVGGTSLLGGRGGYGGTAVGAIIVTLLSAILVGKGYGPAAQEWVVGAVILAVVTVFGRQPRIQDRI